MALRAALAFTLLACTTKRKVSRLYQDRKRGMGGGGGDLRRSALAVRLTAVLINWDLNGRLL